MTLETTTHLICAPEFAGTGTVQQLHATPGSLVLAEALLLTLLLDGQRIEIRAPGAGLVDRFVVEIGDAVESSGLLLMMEVEEEDGEWLEILPPPVVEGDDEPPLLSDPHVARSGYLVVSLAAAQLAARLGVDLSAVAGHGARGEIEAPDVERHVRDLLHARR
ncbi:E3 binding domain-containing protein [Amantichitinum ursilacus]|uniref:Dihydrolipoamide acetyltransferase n=1 Tax=Amantichitinum ursilacus TaxID=857265 RepID=A0A0N0XJX1_9NEIS|nr:E3 binding domain-containing protein [Amantichitinum ursilacus]KPC52136.1 dihydrolipoamide acetyltransferase [Amantichitinum ursilacus]